MATSIQFEFAPGTIRVPVPRMCGPSPAGEALSHDTSVRFTRMARGSLWPVNLGSIIGGIANYADGQLYYPFYRLNPDGENEWYLFPYHFKRLYSRVELTPVYLRCRINADAEVEFYLSQSPGTTRMTAGQPQVQCDDDLLFYGIGCASTESHSRIFPGTPGQV